MYRVTKRFEFEASHCLPFHDGKCARPHGHSYKVEVSVEAAGVMDDGPKRGMVIDFGDISRVWKEKLEPLLDHHDLNEQFESLDVWIGRSDLPTTAENLAAEIYFFFKANDINVCEVSVYETATSKASFYR